MPVQTMREKLEAKACSDHTCIFLLRPRKGMGTNGGCRCVRNKNPFEIERLIRAQNEEIKLLRRQMQEMVEKAAAKHRPAYEEQQRRIMALEDEIKSLKEEKK